MDVCAHARHVTAYHSLAICAASFSLFSTGLSSTLVAILASLDATASDAILALLLATERRWLSGDRLGGMASWTLDTLPVATGGAFVVSANWPASLPRLLWENSLTPAGSHGVDIEPHFCLKLASEQNACRCSPATSPVRPSATLWCLRGGSFDRRADTTGWSLTPRDILLWECDVDSKETADDNGEASFRTASSGGDLHRMRKWMTNNLLQYACIVEILRFIPSQWEHNTWMACDRGIDRLTERQTDREETGTG